jgi:hypothetical protein
MPRQRPVTALRRSRPLDPHRAHRARRGRPSHSSLTHLKRRSGDGTRALASSLSLRMALRGSEIEEAMRINVRPVERAFQLARPGSVRDIWNSKKCWSARATVRVRSMGKRSPGSCARSSRRPRALPLWSGIPENLRGALRVQSRSRCALQRCAKARTIPGSQPISPSPIRRRCFSLQTASPRTRLRSD